VRIAFVIFVNLLFWATSAESQPGAPVSQAPVQPASPPPTQTPPTPPQQPPAPPQQFQPQAQAEAAVPPSTQGRWIHTDEYGSVWIPKTPQQPAASGWVQVPKAPEQSTANSWVWVPKTSDQPIGGGQWVFTAQYGWLWMPYAIQYVHEPSLDSAHPQAFVYHPTYGWTWVPAPWVWGWGVVPFYGSQGPWHFAWYRGPTYIHPRSGLYRGAWINPGRGIPGVVPASRSQTWARPPSTNISVPAI